MAGYLFEPEKFVGLGMRGVARVWAEKYSKLVDPEMVAIRDRFGLDNAFTSSLRIKSSPLNIESQIIEAGGFTEKIGLESQAMINRREVAGEEMLDALIRTKESILGDDNMTSIGQKLEKGVEEFEEAMQTRYDIEIGELNKISPLTETEGNFNSVMATLYKLKKREAGNLLATSELTAIENLLHKVILEQQGKEKLRIVSQNTLT